MGHPIKHFITITKHRHKVIRFCFKMGIGIQGLFHDLSKYSLEEFLVGCRYYSGNCSPNSKERQLKGYSKAWMHHKGRNKHHLEYWVDIDLTTNKYEAVKVPINYVKEMIADRVAASLIYYKDKYHDDIPLKYFLDKDNGLKIHPETYSLLLNWLILVSEKGHLEAFKIIKKIKDY